MPTNEERREVARRLRKLSHGYVTVGDYRSAIGMDDGPEVEYDEVTGEPVLREIDLDDMGSEMSRLAELIEPEPERTCRDVSGCDEFFHCSECDVALIVEYGDSRLFKNDYLLDGFDYCPFCGAKVTKEDTCR